MHENSLKPFALDPATESSPQPFSRRGRRTAYPRLVPTHRSNAGTCPPSVSFPYFPFGAVDMAVLLFVQLNRHPSTARAQLSVFL
jgi:hypothetical protein